MPQTEGRHAGRAVGVGHPCFIIAEIGINHNGDVELAKRLIDAAHTAGCDAVKFQKRTPDLCVPEAQKALPRETPWGVMTYLEYRQRVEFGQEEYAAIDAYCRRLGIPWFASCWDAPSVEFIQQFNPPCHKVASASLTDHHLLTQLKQTGKPLLVSTGMSTLAEVDAALAVLGDDYPVILMHCVSTYPAPPEETNLRVMDTLRERYGRPVGYSGHEVGLQITLAAVALGAVSVERHVTLDRTMWGSDQAASVEPQGVQRLVRDIRVIERALGDGHKRVTPGEEVVRARLRGA